MMAKASNMQRKISFFATEIHTNIFVNENTLYKVDL